MPFTTNPPSRILVIADALASSDFTWRLVVPSGRSHLWISPPGPSLSRSSGGDRSTCSTLSCKNTTCSPHASTVCLPHALHVPLPHAVHVPLQCTCHVLSMPLPGRPPPLCTPRGCLAPHVSPCRWGCQLTSKPLSLTLQIVLALHRMVRLRQQHCATSHPAHLDP